LDCMLTDLISGYMKAVKEKMKEKGASDDEVKEFEKGASGYAKKIVANFKDYDFYTGESMNPDGMYEYETFTLLETPANLLRVVLMNYREDGTTPFVTVWKHGLSQMKV